MCIILRFASQNGYYIYTLLLGQAWYLDSVTIEDPTQGEAYEFMCGKWLSVKAEDKQTRRQLNIIASRKIYAGKNIVKPVLDDTMSRANTVIYTI